ncbi:MAG TPA: hypothetical protein VMW83_16800 [Spirochaetia bacterium]|nr:hypothetical protein [Spirochaetia bacterium]
MRDIFPYLAPGDRLIFCDSGSQDGTAEFMENIARHNPGRAVYLPGVPATAPEDLARFLLAGDRGLAWERLVFWPQGGHEPEATQAMLDELRAGLERINGYSMV